MRIEWRSPYLPSAVVFLVFVFGFTLLNVLSPVENVSVLERRTLAQRPEFRIDVVVSGDFSADFAEYMQDQAAFRDWLRSLRSFTERHVFQKLENNGVYVIDGFIYDKFYGIEQHRAYQAAQRMNEIIADIGPDEVYLSMLPTKAKGIDDGRYLLSDQHEIADVVRDVVNATYIDLMRFSDSETEQRYYGSDPHWTTEGALKAYETLVTALGFTPVRDYTFEVATDEYVGSEYGRAAAWSVPLDTIELARNPAIDALGLCRTTGVDTRNCYDSIFVPITDSTVDDYDIFLGGLAPVIEVTNPNTVATGHLVIFKDSYAHAVAPFLAQHYAKVTLIDLRYVQRDFALEYVDTEGATVLFLYSTSVINTDPRALN